MLPFTPEVHSDTSPLRSKRIAFWLLFGIGAVLACALLLDIYVDWTSQGDPLWSTVLENSIPLLLALTLPYAGWRLLKRRSDAIYLSLATKWTAIGCVGMIVLAGLVVGVQVLQQEVKPALIVLQLATVGGVAGFWVGNNIARVMEAERKTEEERNRLANLLDGLPAPVVHGQVHAQDEGDRLSILNANAAFEEVFGPECEEAIGKNLYDLVVPKEKREEAVDIDRRAIEEGLVEKEVRRLTKEGPRDFRLRVAQALDDGASETYAIYTDITERKERQEELRQKERQYQAVFEDPNILVGLLSPNGRVRNINRTALDYVGTTLDELVEKPFWNTPWFEDDEEVQRRVREWVHRAAEGEYVDFEVDLSTSVGEALVVRGVVRPVTDEQGAVTSLLISDRDITEQKKRKEKLQRTTARLTALFENSPDMINIHDLEGTIIDPNPRFCEKTDYNQEELEGMKMWEIDRHMTPDEAKARWEEMKTGDRVEVEGAYRRRDGSVFPVEVHVRKLDLEGEDRFMAISRDITEQKERTQELRRAKEEAEEASQLKSSMLANLSHEIRTPLTTITGYAELLIEELDGQLANFAERIHQGGQRLMKTLDSMLQLSKLEAGAFDLEPEVVNLPAVVEETVGLLHPQAEEMSVEVVVDLPSHAVEGHWNEGALDRIVENLLENAIKFTPEGGRVEVCVRDEASEAVFEVEDTGVGISEAALPTVFEPFKQESEGLDREFEGTGLGLSIVKEVVELLGGTIQVESEKGEGTRFTVRLPKAPGDVKAGAGVEQT